MHTAKGINQKARHTAGLFCYPRFDMAGLSLSVTSNIKEVKKQLLNFERKQLPFATAKALTDTAKDAQRAVTAQIPRKIDRPTRFTMNAVGFDRATKRRLESAVFIKPIQAVYLRWQIEGGTRVADGAGTGVPTRNKSLNRYGNIPGRRAGLVKGPNEFIATINGVSGVWRRSRSKRDRRPKLLIAFERAVKYQKRLPFYRIAENTARNQFPRRFNSAIALALATAR